ncbi:peptide-methionine (S)-S-oxide reductase MsrA [Labilibacter marinus]|uniref:peptide-methionine (S)-S-oxide reductase MsrA n=1 Tax=Labilibacter marinus TaxID=1477105 RepID=UPI0008321401|nr:peptide-methionine (S)-S-oxide reductase MsrA [Labilibacter marinus]
MKGVFILFTAALFFMSSEAKNKEVATLGAGCFWCVEAIYDQLEGVISVESGYSGGQTDKPTYKEVCEGTTGHAEVCQITFDPEVISFGEILAVFWSVHDPTTLNRQGADVGTQYRSVVYYHNQEQKRIAEAQIKLVGDEKLYEDPIVTEVTAFDKFYQAEDYHQEYFANNPENQYCRMVVGPKVEKFEKLFKDQLKK